MTKLNNEYTKFQIRTWLESQVKKAQSPDPREKLKRLREQRIKKIQKNYGLET